MRKLKETEIDYTMIAHMVSAIVGIALMDEIIAEMRLRRIFRESGYKIFNVRM